MKILIFLGVLLFPTSIFSQLELKHSISAPYYEIKSKSKFYFSDEKKGKTLTIKIVENEICMLSFDSKVNKHIKKNIINDIPNGFVLHDICAVGDKYYCFLNFWDRKNMLAQFFAREIDFDACSFKGEYKKIIEIEYPEKKTLTFTSTVSADKLLVCSGEDPRNMPEKDKYRKYRVYVFDEEMSLLNNGNMLMPYPLNSATLIDYTVSSKNVPYFLFAVSNPQMTKKNKARVPAYAFELFRLNLKNNSIHITKINHEQDKFIKVIRLFERPLNHEMICAGIYGHAPRDDAYVYKPDKDDFPETQGFFVLNINESEGIQHKKYIPYKMDGEGASDQINLTNLEIKDIKVFDDNSIRFIAEESYYYYWESNGSTFYTFYNKDIFVSKVDAKDDLVWMKRLKKDQKGPHTFRSSYTYLMLGEKHYFTFFDHVENKELLGGDDLCHLYRTQKDKGCLRTYCVDDLTGKVSKQLILNSQAIKSNYKIHSMEKESVLPVSSSQFVIEMAQKKPLEMMLKVEVE